MPTIVVVDSSYLIFRSYYAYPHLNTGEKPTGAFFGYAKTIHKLIKDYKPDYLYIAGDLPTPTWRHKILSSYKAGRPEPSNELKYQFPIVQEYAKLIASGYYTIDGYEADDIILNLAVKFMREDKNSKIIIFSADRDLYQILVEPNVFFVRDENLFGRNEFEEKYGVKTEQWVDYKALIGDASDNLKGVSGIGPKTATTILNNCGTLINIFAYLDGLEVGPIVREYLDKNPKIVAKIRTDFEILNQTFELATLQMIPELEVLKEPYDLAKGKAMFEEYNFKSLLLEIEKTEKAQELQKAKSGGSEELF